jgi:small-conductance mechanosensitive channel
MFFVAAQLTRQGIGNFSQRHKRHRNVGLVLGRMAQGGLMLVGALVALVITIPSFQPAQLIQILGISGVAIGFAFREILQNFLAGILILLTEPFRLGDQIEIGTLGGAAGSGAVPEARSIARALLKDSGRDGKKAAWPAGQGRE